MKSVFKPKNTSRIQEGRLGKNVFRSRKKRRKAERKAKKAKRNVYYLNKSKSKGDKIKTEPLRKLQTDKSVKPSPKPLPEKRTIRPKVGKNRRHLTSDDVRRLQLKEANVEDEKAIKRLEKQLKLNRRRKKNTLPKSFTEDGLGYVLEVLNKGENPKDDVQLSDAESELSDDLARALGKQVTSNPSVAESEHTADTDEFFEVQPCKESSEDATRVSEKQKTVSNKQETDNSIKVCEGSNVSDDTSASMKGKQILRWQKDSKSKKVASKTMMENPSKQYYAMEESGDSEIESCPSEVEDADFEDSQKTNHGKVLGQKERNDESNDCVSSSDSENHEMPQRKRASNTEHSEVSAKRQRKGNPLPDKKEESWEDIYGRMRDKKGNIVKSNDRNVSASYIPPAKRDDSVKDHNSLNLQRLNRHLKGLLNRLSESNIQPISHQIENMYMNHSRNDVNQSLVSLVLDAVVLKSLTAERMVMEHSLLVAVLHGNIGMEVGAHFLNSLVKRLDSLFAQGNNYGQEKECDNLLLLLLHLYTFKVTSSILIFDILKKLGEQFQEKDLDLILLSLRSVGFQLRKDNPLALKELIVTLQGKAASFQHDQSRIRFMLETLLAIRNNNVHKIPNYDPSLAEHLKKVLRGVLRKGCQVQELSVSLDDLLRSDERGRWWIVGSAWSGKTEQQQVTTAITETGANEKILDLAAKQRMNTDVRKAIFCILMTAEDFLDAFEKLVHLNLKNQQEREIVHVALDCCLQEKRFNRYYALLLDKFCRFDRRLKMTLQFSLWDKFKELERMNARQMTNMAQLLVQLLTDDSLPLSVLKTVELSEMNRPMVKFLRQVLLGILLHEKEETCRRVFARIAPAPKLQMMREGLRLFLHHFLLRGKHKLDGHVADKLQERVLLAESALLSADKKLKL